MFHLHVHVGGSAPAPVPDVSAEKIGDGQLLKSIIAILIQLGIIKIPVPTAAPGDQVSGTP